mgnify:CR=1 FL=1
MVVFITFADVLARTISAPYELPVGLFTAFLGIPVFYCKYERRYNNETKHAFSSPYPSYSSCWFLCFIWKLSIVNNRIISTLAGNGTKAQEFAIFQIRLPRTLLALLVGCALGVSGGLLQGVSRNPLAEPGMIGINAGACLICCFMDFFTNNTILFFRFPFPQLSSCLSLRYLDLYQVLP